MDITSLGTDYASELASNALTNAKNSALTGRDLKNADDEELKDACKQFEEYFVEQIFKKALKSTVYIKFILLKPFARCQRESQRYACNDVLLCSTG